MPRTSGYWGVVGIAAALGLGSCTQSPESTVSFFVTSHNPGSGGNLGGLAGADAHCQSLAEAAGYGDGTWHAYLSTSTVDARDRVGSGPWYNVEGVMIAENVEQLHSDNHINGDTALDENGDKPPYLVLVDGQAQRAGDSLAHDIMTGTNDDGTANELTCNNWTDGSADSQAMLGHADRLGREAGVNSWVAVHPSQGCGMEQLRPTGSEGLLYCFAID